MWLVGITDVTDAGHRLEYRDISVAKGATLNVDDLNSAGDSTRESWCLALIHSAQATGLRVLTLWDFKMAHCSGYGRNQS